jgi:hypothetical protein
MENEMGLTCKTQDMRNEYKILVGTPEGKRPLGGTRRINRVWRCALDSSGSGRDRRLTLLNTVMNLRVPYSGKLIC